MSKGWQDRAAAATLLHAAPGRVVALERKLLFVRAIA
jgi:hypothetical protein